MQKSFSFKGINRCTDVLLANDGECLDVVNMRMTGGSLLPMPQPGVVAELRHACSAFYRHATSGCYIGITADNVRTLHFYDNNFSPLMSGGRMLVFEGLQGVNGLEFVGNIVCCLTSSGIYYLLFDGGTYIALGERPPVPDVAITVSSKVESITTDDAYYSTSETDDVELSWIHNEKGYIDECISALNKEGYYIDRALFRVALRLYDGSYINISNIVYVSDEATGDGIGRDDRNMVSEAMDKTSPSRYRVSVRGFKPEFTFSAPGLQAWRNIVVGLDVFSTMSIPGKESVPEKRLGNSEIYTAKPLEELWEEIASASLYYKIAEYDIDGNRLNRLDDVSPSSLALQQGLETATVPSSLSGYDVKSSFIYNGRLHIAAFKEYFFKGYDATAYRPVGSAVASVDSMVVQVKLRTTQGEFVTGNCFKNPLLGNDGFAPVLPPLLTYPDARASEMAVYLDIAGSVYCKRFPLKAHNYLNMAYYLHRWYVPFKVTVSAVFANGGTPSASVDSEVVVELFGYETGTHEVIYSASRNCWTYKDKTFPPSQYSSLRIFAIHRNAVDGDKLVFTIKRGEITDSTFKDIDNITFDDTWQQVDGMPVTAPSPCENRYNVMKVSMVENPFVFPANSTYTPSQSAIVGLSSNTVALSEGQFGQYPLYVFCTDGIWAMSVDTSGSMAYLACNQVSRDVCVNAASICGVGGGVLFAGKQGMMLIAGNNVNKISAVLDCVGSSSKGVPGDLFTKISGLVSLECNCGNFDFQSFITDAFVSYIASHNEVIVANAAFGYSFVFSLDSGVWTRYTGYFKGKVYGATAPLFLAPSSNGGRVVTIPDTMSGDNRVLLFTRPQIWGTKLPKRIMQLLLHAYVAPPAARIPGMPLLACYLLGSNDGTHFKIVAGSEKNVATQDVLFPYSPTSSYKYYLFAIVGYMGGESVVTGMEMAVELPWRNRLR